jgi:hypothetical protein
MERILMFIIPSGRWLPKDYSGIRFWIDASNVSNGSNPANNSSISSWVDLSGVSGNAAQATGTKQPIFRENIQNGLPGVEFDGANSQCMQVASVACGSQLTLFCVVEQFNASAAEWFIVQSPNINTNDGFYMYGRGIDGFPGSIKNSGVLASTATSSGWLGDDPVLAMIRYNGTTIEAWRNGSQLVTGSASITNNTVTNVLNIGSRNQSALFFDGYLYEVILYNGALSNNQVLFVNNYLRSKWALY